MKDITGHLDAKLALIEKRKEESENNRFQMIKDLTRWWVDGIVESIEKGDGIGVDCIEDMITGDGGYRPLKQLTTYEIRDLYNFHLEQRK